MSIGGSYSVVQVGERWLKAPYSHGDGRLTTTASFEGAYRWEVTGEPTYESCLPAREQAQHLGKHRPDLKVVQWVVHATAVAVAYPRAPRGKRT